MIAFLLRYLNGEANKALSYGLRQIVYFLAGIAAIKMSVRNAFAGTNVFFRKYYFPAMLLCSLQLLWYGWKKKTGMGNYLCLLFGEALLLLSPFYMILLTGGLQPMRTYLVYPVTASLFLAHLTVASERTENAANQNPCKEQAKLWRREWKSGLVAAVCLFCAMNQGSDTIQLFQTAKEAFRNDVLTANRMYPDICRTAEGMDMKECVVFFTGGRSAHLQGPAVYGELVGRSFFDAEAHTPIGVSSRVGCLFSILGMDMVVKPEWLDQYHQAIELMKDAPDWPAQGSVRRMGDMVVVRLSESWI